MGANEETALAEAMIQRHGADAPWQASNQACVQAAMGDEDGAAKWRRVMALIAKLARPPI